MAKVIAKETFLLALKDGQHRIAKGQEFDSGHRYVKANKGAFLSSSDYAALSAPVVHTATAAPGEQRSQEKPPVEDDKRRGVGIPPKPKAKKPAAKKAAAKKAAAKK